MKLTLDAAAKQIGTSKSTLLRAIRSGALTAEKRGERAFVVDASELFRWRDARTVDAPPEEPGRITPQPVAQPAAAPDHAADLAAWRVRAEMLERMLDAERATVADLRARLDVAQNATREAIAAIPRQIAPPVEASRAETQPAGWLGRWRRG